MNRRIILIAHDIRSAHNVGALFRLADGLGLDKLILTGYTPYPREATETRLPHLATKIHNRIVKTALGAELTIGWNYEPDISALIERLKSDGFTVVGLEQDKSAINLADYKAPEKIALVLGNEVNGIDGGLRKQLDQIIEIPMLGKKESHNVVTAAAMSLYHLRFN